MQCTYSPISHEVNATRQWNLINWFNIIRETVFFKNYAENEEGRLVPEDKILIGGKGKWSEA